MGFWERSHSQGLYFRQAIEVWGGVDRLILAIFLEFAILVD